jgi:hypothetical protein
MHAAHILGGGLLTAQDHHLACRLGVNTVVTGVPPRAPPGLRCDAGGVLGTTPGHMHDSRALHQAPAPQRSCMRETPTACLPGLGLVSSEHQAAHSSTGGGGQALGEDVPLVRLQGGTREPAPSTGPLLWARELGSSEDAAAVRSNRQVWTCNLCTLTRAADTPKAEATAPSASCCLLPPHLLILKHGMQQLVQVAGLHHQDSLVSGAQALQAHTGPQPWHGCTTKH